MTSFFLIYATISDMGINELTSSMRTLQNVLSARQCSTFMQSWILYSHMNPYTEHGLKPSCVTKYNSIEASEQCKTMHDVVVELLGWTLYNSMLHRGSSR